jgi:hypothetical protein
VTEQGFSYFERFASLGKIAWIAAAEGGSDLPVCNL